MYSLGYVGCLLGNRHEFLGPLFLISTVAHQVMPKIRNGDGLRRPKNALNFNI